MTTQLKREISTIDKRKERVTYVDFAKGVTILFVIIGHMSQISIILKYFIFSFHMPMFFLTSGLFIRDYSIGKNLKRSIKNLLIPYSVIHFLCMGIELIRSIVVSKELGQADVSIVARYVKAYLGGMSYASKVFTSFESVWLIWFICCLFLARFFYILLSHVIKDKGLRFIAILFISYDGVVLGKLGYYLPWSFDVAMFAVIYLAAGDLIAKTKLFEKWHTKTYIIMIPFCVWFVCLLQKEMLELAVRTYGNYIGAVVMSIAGCVFVLGVSRELDGWNETIARFFRWCGRRSIVILAFHLFEMRFLDWNIVYTLIPVSGSWILETILHVVLILSASYIIVRQIKRCFIQHFIWSRFADGGLNHGRLYDAISANCL